MNVKAIDFIMYPASDYKRTVSFYRDTLGLKLTSEYGGFWAEFETGNATLAISTYSQPKEGVRGGGAAVALAVDDVRKAVAELKAKGVSIKAEPEETGVCFMATIVDPDGNEIILHHRRDGSAG